ncbi:YchJ family protein [Desulfobaculum bizertense]|uniref:SEC-C motif-containing protein n=1 Tax=Desulfobaculum bizertense DSM 18034 TaxID=1121442 RepID=A0A1T4WAY4_9BACT|nr:YchJ family protein [Desulfobaculum bizertense]SKA74357.1 SEC-C motif-containing protein [Desulfobaculum bizertense DSM 18034]
MSTPCYCGSGKDYAECCEPIITGKISAPTAESLMRARYSAYCVKDLDFLRRSVSEQDGYDEDAVRDWADSSVWNGLTIHSVKDGQESDKSGEVEFSAEYEYKGQKLTHRELSYFSRQDGNWIYTHGRVRRGNETVRRESPKVGRNDPCPCGSGKKFKKCCGRA